MTRDHIEKEFRHMSLWVNASPALKFSFAEEMRGRQFGDDALFDAFCWFVHGWHGALADERERSKKIPRRRT